MGKTFCVSSNHPELHKRDAQTCWGCDRCPKEHQFRLGRGAYCSDCVKRLKAKGLVWSDYTQNYETPEDKALGDKAQKEYLQKKAFEEFEAIHKQVWG